MDYERFTTEDGREFIRVSINTTTMSEEEFQAIRRVFKEVKGRFDSREKIWVIPIEGETYFQGLVSGLGFKPNFNLPKPPQPSAEDNYLFLQETAEEEKKRSGKIPNHYQLDFINTARWRRDFFQRIIDEGGNFDWKGRPFGSNSPEKAVAEARESVKLEENLIEDACEWRDRRGLKIQGQGI